MSDAERKLPLDAWHRARGARMVPFAGYIMPVQYDGIIAEHLWTRSSAGLFDVSHMGQFRVSGTEVDRALETVVPGDLTGLGEGRLRYSVLPNDAGGIVDDLILTRRADHFYLVVNGATCAQDLAYLRERLGGVAVEHMAELALLALQGPKAAAVLEELAPGVGELGFMSGGSFPLGDIRVWISRSGYTGEDGFEISLPSDRAQELADRLVANDAVRPIGLGARDSLRLEAGLPLYGHDLDPETSPIEAGLAFIIPKRRREVGGFPGEARILEELRSGPRQRRVGLKVAGRQPVREGSEVVDAEGRPIGRVTSGGHSPSLEAPIAMAYVPAELATNGTQLRLSQRGRIFEAEVADMPFVPHRYHRRGASQ